MQYSAKTFVLNQKTIYSEPYVPLSVLVLLLQNTTSYRHTATFPPSYPIYPRSCFPSPCFSQQATHALRRQRNNNPGDACLAKESPVPFVDADATISHEDLVHADQRFEVRNQQTDLPSATTATSRLVAEESRSEAQTSREQAPSPLVNPPHHLNAEHLPPQEHSHPTLYQMIITVRPYALAADAKRNGSKSENKRKDKQPSTRMRNSIWSYSASATLTPVIGHRVKIASAIACVAHA